MKGLPRGWSADELQSLGRSLTEVADTAAQKHPGMLSRWLHGPRYTDIFVDVAPGGDLDRIEISYGGNWLLIEGKRLLTGHTDEMSVLDEERHPKARTIQEHSDHDAEIIRGARILVEALADPILAPMILARLPAAATG